MRFTIHVASLLVAFGLAGCRDDAEVGVRDTDPAYPEPTEPYEPTGPYEPAEPWTEDEPGEPWHDVEPTWDELKRMGADARDGLTAALERTIERADEEIQKFRESLQSEDELEGPERDRLEELERDLEQKRQQVTQKMEELRDATAERFEEARAAFFEAYERFESKLAEAKDELGSD